MIEQDIEFYNVSEFELDEKNEAYSLLRLPKKCEANMLEQGINMNRSALGVELRFALMDDEIEITLKGKDEDGMCFVYFGSVQAEWFQSSYVIKANQDTIIKIKKANDAVKGINEAKGSIYPAEMVRILFNGTKVQFKSKKGRTRVVPFNAKTILFYGSSITANSITYIPMISYPSLIASSLKLDLRNVGFPGSCRMEKEVVDEISSFPFDYAFIELGINIINEISLSEYKEKCTYLLKNITASKKQVFVTDIYSYFNERCGVSDRKLSSFRNSLKRLTKEYDNVVYVSGKSLLKDRTNLCADLVHPDINGHLSIYGNLLKIMKKKMN